MIGNDIIDLHQSRKESNWQRKSWLNKLFSKQEIANIMQSPDAEITIWLYWSMKEAAYKIYNRMSGKISFAPSRFICSITDSDKDTSYGYVLFNDAVYHTQSNISNDYIHSIARLNLYQSINLLMDNNTEDVCLPHHLSLHKDSQHLPYLLNNNTGATYIASKSHHGRFQALVY